MQIIKIEDYQLKELQDEVLFINKYDLNNTELSEIKEDASPYELFNQFFKEQNNREMNEEEKIEDDIDEETEDDTEEE